MNRRAFFKNTLALSTLGAPALSNAQQVAESFVHDVLDSMSIAYSHDVYLDASLHDIFESVARKLNNVRRVVGFGNFNIISFDYTLRIAQRYSQVGGAFSKEEIDFMEYIFSYDPSIHGFYGKKTCDNITDTIKSKEVVKIPYSGHYLYKGKVEQIYAHMTQDVGSSLILTSGVRSVIKQMSLFLNKLKQCNKNMTLAGKSLAPPAYSYHSLGDFDVGKKGLGYDNFTSRFALTSEFQKMKKLKYIDMRYTVNNKDGVRYEPWHVKII